MSGGLFTSTVLAEKLGVVKTTVLRRAEKEGWDCISGKNRTKFFKLASLPADIQRKLVERMEKISTDIIPSLAPEAALAATEKISGETGLLKPAPVTPGGWNDASAMSMDVIRDPRVRRIAGIVQEALNVPTGEKKRAHIERVALRHDTSWQTIYKWIKKYESGGLAAIKHSKKNRGRAKKWTPEAIDFWAGLCLKREHRRIDKVELYSVLVIEAERKGWPIGGYSSALDWFNKISSPQLTAMQRGGARALDNQLPPVLRKYSDLYPFELLVGDQHRFDFWVVDDDTGEVFRPEGYFWQDLRTRCFYGGAVDRKYDAYLCGLALRMGIRIFGAFSAIYTDNGRPELSRYIMGILADMKTLGLSAEKTEDGHLPISDADAEKINPCVILPGTHKRAIVKNAKAKMIEGTFDRLESILRNIFRMPGGVKRLNASDDEQDIDQKDIERLARAGKLLTFAEFTVKLYQALDYYNSTRPHRGVLAEWPWKPKPKSVTPVDCLRRLYMEGWRPRRLSEEAVDLVFLAQVPRGRVVDRGRIHLHGRVYEHDDLIELSGSRVELRFDPMDPEWLLVFSNGDFACRAVPVELSSMKNQSLAARKIEEKRRLRKAFINQYRELTSKVPDIREYSQVPAIERTAAMITKKEKTEAKRIRERVRPRTDEQLAAEVACIENYHQGDRPVFMSEVDRYQWGLTQAALIDEDTQFMVEYEARMDDDTRAYWQVYKDQASLCELCPGEAGG